MDTPMQHDPDFPVPRRTSEPDDHWAETTGRRCALIFFTGLFICIALCLVAAGIAAVRWAL